MGQFLNPGGQMFQMALNSEIYIDKSGLIAHLNRRVNTEQRFVCVSRPRRFGKTVTGNMLCAYYGKNNTAREQFANLQIAQDPSFESHLNTYDVIQLNIRDFITEARTIEEMLSYICEDISHDIERIYPDLLPHRRQNLANVLAAVYAETGTQFVFVIDEWDSIFRVHQHDTGAQTLYLDWLRNLLKDKPYVALAYMTGILPIKKYGEHSALNMFTEFSMANAWPIEEYTGFTEGEVMELCERYGRSIEDVRRWYDGYTVGNEAIYNPRSAVMAIPSGVYDNYWTQTENFEALRIYIEMDMDGLRERVVRLLAGESIELDTTTFVNDMTTFASADDVLTLLVHLGYLTYNRATGLARIPNLEVAQQYGSIMRTNGWEEVARAIRESNDLLAATLAGDTDRVAKLVSSAHEDSSSILRYNDENSLACALSIAYYAARRSYTVVREMPTGKGFADLVFIPRQGDREPVLVVELKARGTSADSALAQIRERRYAQGVKGLTGNVLLVAITYDPMTKEHDCIIEPAEV